MTKKLPDQKTTFITFIYKDNRKSKTTRNIDIATSILDADHDSIKIINWNWVRFTVEELLAAEF